MVVEQEEIARLLDGHRAGKFLDHLLDEANAAFRVVDSGRAKQLLFGFVAATAVASLSRVSVREAATKGTSRLIGLSGELLGVAQERATETSQHRSQAGQQFNSNVWGLVANALLALSLRDQLARQGLAGRHATYAENVALTIFKDIDRLIALYAAADAKALEEAGIAGAVRMVDPSKEIRKSQEAGKSHKRSRWWRRSRDEDEKEKELKRIADESLVTSLFPVGIGLFGYQLYGWVGAIGTAALYLAAVVLLNQIVVRTALFGADPTLRMFIRIKWTLFIIFMIGISVSGASWGRI